MWFPHRFAIIVDKIGCIYLLDIIIKNISETISYINRNYHHNSLFT